MTQSSKTTKTPELIVTLSSYIGIVFQTESEEFELIE
jgi:hypothetical protein